MMASAPRTRTADTDVTTDTSCTDTAAVRVRRLGPSELGRVERFYHDTDYGGGVSADDDVLVAERGEQLVGALRLCREFDVVVLRGMRVRDGFRRQGIGTALLRGAAEAVGKRVCYAIPHRYLRGFYAQVGFDEQGAADAPRELRARLEQYREWGLDAILMRRSDLCN
jgi:GNAT superfamily N-acetyltransferase